MTWIIVLGPLAAYALSLVARAALGRAPRRAALNVETSLLLAVYVLATAGLGLFWVANQQLPPFDWHYLSGYATLALLGTHLNLNLPTALRQLRRRERGTVERSPRPGRPVLRLMAWAVVVAAAYWLGMRAGTTTLVVPGSTAGADAAGAPVIARYHEFSSHSRLGVVARAPSVHWGEPVSPHMDRPGLPRVQLAPPDLERRAQAIATLGDVTNIVWAMAGITERRGGLELRTAASSGALFPTEVYVSAWQVEGLAPGLYAYAPLQHALARIADTPLDPHAIGAPELGDRAASFAVVASSVFRRTGQKYRDRTYRYVTADAGHALGNAVAAARSMGMAARFVPRFDDERVGALLGLRAEEEGVLALLALERPGSPQAVAPAVLAPVPLPEARGLALGATALTQLATSLRIAAPVAEPPEGVLLPGGASPPLGVLRSLSTRRSARTFAPRPLTLEELAATLSGAGREPPLLSRALRVHVIAPRVTGLAPGAYRYDPEQHRLRRERAGELGREAGRAALDQSVIGEAPAILVLGLDRRVLDQEGARAYRHGFIEAGMVGARLYLASTAIHLGGCSVGAFYDDELARLIAVELEREWPVHLFALGAPP